jgi:hypothetical protein
VALERVEAAVPHRAIWLEPGIDLTQRKRLHAIQASLSIDTGLDETRLAEHPKMLRYRGLSDVERVDQLSNGALAFAQQIENHPSVRLGHHLECRPGRHENII